MDNITSLIIKIINNQCGIKEYKLQPYHRLQSEINLDSIDVYNLIMEFEDAFDICIEDEDIKHNETISYYSALITRLKHEQHR